MRDYREEKKDGPDAMMTTFATNEVSFFFCGDIACDHHTRFVSLFTLASHVERRVHASIQGHTYVAMHVEGTIMRGLQQLLNQRWKLNFDVFHLGIYKIVFISICYESKRAKTASHPPPSPH